MISESRKLFEPAVHNISLPNDKQQAFFLRLIKSKSSTK